MRKTRRTRVVALWLSLALMAVGCGGEGASTPSAADAADAADAAGVGPADSAVGSPADELPPIAESPFAGVADCVACGPEETCGDGDLTLTRVAPWVGGGLQLTMAVTGRREASEPPLFSMTVRGGENVPLAVEPLPAGPGITAVLLFPSAIPAVHAARIEAATALIDAMPEGERVAGWLAAGSYPLLADLSSRRGHLLRRIASVLPGPSAALSRANVDGLRKALAEVEEKWGRPARTLVVVGREPLSAEPPPEPEGFAPVDVVWLADGESGNAAAEAIAERRAQHWRVGACSSLEKNEPLVLRAGGRRCVVAAPKPLAHMGGVACDRDAAARDDYPYGDDVYLTFNDAQREIYEQRYADRDRDEFTLSVTLGEGDAMAATANLRGSSSLGCRRKSLSVNLDGGSARRLMPGAASDEFYLLSMCLDDRYFNQTFADRLLQPMGLFPLDFRYVRLHIDGHNRGVYMMLEKTEDTLRDEHLEVATVIRRRYDFEGKPEEIKYPDDEADMADASARFRGLDGLIDTTPPDALLEALSQQMDFENYLRWLAVNTFLKNGDYIDEAYFYASPEGSVDPSTAGAGAGWYFRHMGWDPDDLFSACHGSGKNAIDDPHGILYCAEALLDYSLVESPTVYAAFIDELEYVLATLDDEHLEATMAEIRAELWQILSDDETAAAMLELTDANPAATSVDIARQDIHHHMNTMLTEATTHRTQLEQSITNYRDQVGGKSLD